MVARTGGASEQNIRNKTLIRHCDGGNAKSRAAGKAASQPASQRVVKNREMARLFKQPKSSYLALHLQYFFASQPKRELHMDWRACFWLTLLFYVRLMAELGAKK